MISSNLLSGPSHLRCESVGLKLMKPGTDSTDSECGEHGPEAGLVAGIVITGVILALIIIAIILRKKIRGKCCININVSCYSKLTCFLLHSTNMYHGYAE